MRSMSYAFTALLLVAAIAAPTALARPAGDPPALAHEIAASSTPSTPPWPADPQPIAPAVTQPAPSDDGFPWETVGLVLVAAAVGLTGTLAVVRVRRRTHRHVAA